MIPDQWSRTNQLKAKEHLYFIRIKPHWNEMFGNGFAFNVSIGTNTCHTAHCMRTKRACKFNVESPSPTNRFRLFIEEFCLVQTHNTIMILNFLWSGNEPNRATTNAMYQLNYEYWRWNCVCFRVIIEHEIEWSVGVAWFSNRFDNMLDSIYCAIFFTISISGYLCSNRAIKMFDIINFEMKETPRSDRRIESLFYYSILTSNMLIKFIWIGSVLFSP